jgi:hypothetical protein
VGVAASGETVVAWTSGDSARWRVEVSIQAPGGSFGAHRTVSGPTGLQSRLLRLVVSDRGDALVLFDREQSLWAAFRPAGGEFGPPEHVADVSFQSIEAAIDVDGDAVVLWAPRSGGGGRVQAAARPAGGTFGPAQELAPDGIGAVVGMDANGNAVAAWWKDGIQVSERPSGGSWAQARRIDTPRPASSVPSLAVGPRGDAVVVWRTSGSTAYPPYFANQPPVTEVIASTRAPGGDFGDPQVVANAFDDPYRLRPEQTAATVDANGHIAVAWERPEPRSIEVALRPAGRDFLPPEAIPGSQSYVERSLKIAFAGQTQRTTVFWDQDLPGVTRQFMAERTRSGWSRPAVVADYEYLNTFDRYERSPFGPVVDFDPGGRATSVWPAPRGPHAQLAHATYDPAAPQPPAAEITSMKVRPRRFVVGRRRRGATKIVFEVTRPTNVALIIRADGSSTDSPGYGSYGSPYVIRRHARAGRNRIRFNGVVETPFGRREFEPYDYDVWLVPTGPGPVGGVRLRSFVIGRG